MTETLIVFLPLIGFLIAGLLGRVIGDRGAMAVTVALVCLSALLSIFVFFDVVVNGHGHDPIHTVLGSWVDVGELSWNWAIYIDTLTAVMLVVVTVVSAMVHIYSIGYMSHDKSRARFFAYLSLFTFAMLMLVTADNFVQLFFGWEGVGVASYLLIGFWHHKDSANSASMKAFVVNRVGDFGLALGIFAIYLVFGTVEFEPVFEAVAEHADSVFILFGWEVHAMTAIGLLLFIGAMGKSAQLGLHTWLPDAMEGPTPVSALIHAATMVTAGVFLVARASPIYEYAPDALMFIAVLGASTAFVAATIGLTQFDIKRVIAYSTMSQLGYMFFALGVSAYSAAIFHLMTHAFFKALLFLGAGSVIHAMSDEQDMRKMGGIRKMIPKTYAMMWIGSLALCGVGIPLTYIGFAGFFSKDLVLEAAWADATWFGHYAFWMGVVAAFMTSFYSGRLLFMTFHGAPRADEKVMAHVHESPWVMLGPLVVLAVGAVLAGFVAYDIFAGHHYIEHYWGHAILVLEGNDTVTLAHEVDKWVKILPVLMGVGGLALSYYFYVVQPGMPQKVVDAAGGINTLFFRKWYFDEMYHAAFVVPAAALGRFFWRGGDMGTIDRFGPDGLAATTKNVAGRSSKLQTGYLFHYAFAMLIGVVVLISWYLLRAPAG